MALPNGIWERGETGARACAGLLAGSDRRWDSGGYLGRRHGNAIPQLRDHYTCTVPPRRDGYLRLMAGAAGVVLTARQGATGAAGFGVHEHDSITAASRIGRYDLFPKLLLA